MVLRMKNFNVLGVHWKIRLLEEGFTKNQYRGGVDTPMRTMRVVQNLKRNLFFVSKMIRIWWILIWALKSLKHLHFDWSLVCKVYNVWPKKVQRSIFHDTEESCKIWRKTGMWFGKWLEEFSKFSSEHLKMSKLVFSWDPIVQSIKCMSYKLHELQRIYK